METIIRKQELIDAGWTDAAEDVKVLDLLDQYDSRVKQLQSEIDVLVEEAQGMKEQIRNLEASNEVLMKQDETGMATEIVSLREQAHAAHLRAQTLERYAYACKRDLDHVTRQRGLENDRTSQLVASSTEELRKARYLGLAASLASLATGGIAGYATRGPQKAQAKRAPARRATRKRQRK